MMLRCRLSFSLVWMGCLVLLVVPTCSTRANGITAFVIRQKQPPQQHPTTWETTSTTTKLNSPLPFIARRQRQQQQRRTLGVLCASEAGGAAGGAGVGLYRPVAEWVWDKILSEFPTLKPVVVVPSNKQKDDDDEGTTVQPFDFNEAPAKGAPPGTVVRMETRACSRPVSAKDNDHCPIRYARLALLETIPPPPEAVAESKDDDDGDETATIVHSAGIQVLNLVVFPDEDTNLPVWGADFVSLPGDKHLLLLDAQPMTTVQSAKQQYEASWKEWYQTHIATIDGLFPWGGDLPEPVQKYVSSYALWTRFVPTMSSADDSDRNEQDENNDDVMDPLERIQGPLVTACREHFAIYCRVLKEHTTDDDANVAQNHQAAYVEYRLANDPARPMLQALYGKGWTEQVLQQVLFPRPATTSTKTR